MLHNLTEVSTGHGFFWHTPPMGTMLRSLSLADAPAAAKLELSVHPPQLHEGEEFFAKLLSRWHGLCLGVFESHTNALIGYLLSHPCSTDEIPGLGCLPEYGGQKSEFANCWFIHDLVVAPAARAQHLAKDLLSLGAQSALDSGLKSCRIVAVNESASWWSRLGFTPVLPSPSQIDAVAIKSYGQAVLMEAPAQTVLEIARRKALP